MLPWVNYVSSFSGTKIKLYLHHYRTTAYYDKIYIFFFCFTLIFLRINLALFVSEFGFEGRWGFFVVIVLRVFFAGGVVNNEFLLNNLIEIM